jgi:hypothetical protein
MRRFAARDGLEAISKVPRIVDDNLTVLTPCVKEISKSSRDFTIQKLRIE